MQTDQERGAEAAGLEHDACVAVVEEIEAAVDPEALLVYGDVLLRVDRPVSGFGDGAADFWIDFGRHFGFVCDVGEGLRCGRKWGRMVVVFFGYR